MTRFCQNCLDMMWSFLDLASQIERGHKQQVRVGFANLYLQVEAPNKYHSSAQDRLVNLKTLPKLRNFCSRGWYA